MADINNPQSQFCGRTRREFLWEAGAGFGAVGLAEVEAA